MKPGDTQVSKRFKAAGWRAPTQQEISSRIDIREKQLNQNALNEMKAVLQRDGGLSIQNIGQVIDTPRKFGMVYEKVLTSAGSGLQTVFDAAVDRGLLAGVSTANEVTGRGILNVAGATTSVVYNSLPVGVQSDVSEFVTSTGDFIRGAYSAIPTLWG
jgi:hypothetical protein